MIQPHEDPDVLRELLVERGLPVVAAAGELGVAPKTVSLWADRLGVRERDIRMDGRKNVRALEEMDPDELP